MSISSKAESLIILLTRETFDGSVTWSDQRPPSGLTDGTENKYPLYLSTEYKNVEIGIFQRRYKYFTDEDEYHWCEEVGLCVIGNSGQVTWEYSERSTALANLFEAAREQASGIDGLLDNLLS